jgi:hypothetical protein
MKRCLVVCALLLAFVPTAAATEATIYPGVGIGNVKLGMTKAQVERFLGKPDLVNAREGAYTEYAWSFATWSVGFIHGRAVQVATTLTSQRTPDGVGPGSSWQKLVTSYPHSVCTPNSSPAHGGLVEILVPHKGDTQTIFFVRQGRTYSTENEWHVAEVWVRTRWKALPEFQPSWNIHCSAGWQTSDKP